eukprot:NODE_1134_length_1087_cov_209.766859_g867_i0.p1 GENE.NODE_1134_length_1087_cov_209.766859_g867_i0~~NODE_1134_length_1087_cov_209.766859_g867_i0.p1  ORF type:complete len:302 (-),score=99.60 NODE_1134_length_1087_cov_209.766859_g867_i0:181-1029(-)
MTCCFTIPQSEVGITESWGKFADVVRPGCHFVNCISTQLAGSMSLRVQELTVRIETKTKDNVFVFVVISVQYKILETKIYEAYYTLENAEQQLTSYVFNNVRAQIPQYALDELFAGKDEIAVQLKHDLEEQMNDFGYTIIQTLITDIDPDDLVKKAMNEINAAQRMRVAAVDKAEAERITVVKSAEAEAESKRLSGVGLAEQRKAVVSGLHESIVTFAEAGDISHGEVMELLLMNQYFDTLKDMTHQSKATAMFVPHTPDTVSTLSIQMREGLMQATRQKVE